MVSVVRRRTDILRIYGAEDIVRMTIKPTATILVNNPLSLAVSVVDQPSGRWRLLVYRKGDSTWRQVDGVPFSLVRGFGDFIALAETEPKTDTRRESAGRTEWRDGYSKTGPSLIDRFSRMQYLIPGRLDLYNVATEKMYKIVTNQADSEILLVDNNTVYYRVSDRLYSAVIGPDALEPARLLATSDQLRDVHWAFVRH